MLQDGIIFIDTSVAENLQIQHGSSLPIAGNNVGELFYLTTGAGALYIYDGSSWQLSSGAGQSSYTISGDASGTIDGGTDTLTLSTVNSNVGTFGSATQVPVLTVNSKGLVTAVSTATVNGFDPTSSQTITGSWSFSQPVSGQTPTASSHLATKDYVDTFANGLKPHESVRVATTANITLSGTQTIDGVAVYVGNRVLVKN